MTITPRKIITFIMLACVWAATIPSAAQIHRPPEYHTVTAQWTFNGQWDPEQTVRNLWKYIRY